MTSSDDDSYILLGDSSSDETLFDLPLVLETGEGPFQNCLEFSDEVFCDICNAPMENEPLSSH